MKVDAVGQFDQAVSQAAAIDLHGGMGAPEDRDVLIHDAARHAHEIALGALAELRQFQRVELAPGEQRQGGGDLQRGRGTQARAIRHRAADQQVRSFDGHAGAHQFAGHADGVIGPLARGLRGGERRRVELAQFAAVFRIEAKFAVARRGRGDVSGEVQRYGQDEAEIVVGVLADQIDPAGRPEHTRLLCGAEPLAE